jgi:hypothetical protein
MCWWRSMNSKSGCRHHISRCMTRGSGSRPPNSSKIWSNHWTMRPASRRLSLRSCRNREARNSKYRISAPSFPRPSQPMLFPSPPLPSPHLTSPHLTSSHLTTFACPGQ